MKTKSLRIISVVAIGLFAVSITCYAQGVDTRIGTQVMQATTISKEEAQKKYPPPGGGYPSGQRDPKEQSGIVYSPYPPNQKYDCSKVNHGALVLDVRVHKVFVRP